MKTGILRSVALVLVIAASLAACDSPIDPDLGQIEGVVLLRSNGSEAARFLLVGSVVTGGLQVNVGQTATFQVRGINNAGNIFPLTGSGYSIRDATVVIGLRATANVQGGDQLVIQGLQAGNTTVRFILQRSGQALFEAEDIPLSVS
jgi:hypothetical protein